MHILRRIKYIWNESIHCSTSLEPDDESLGDQRVFDVLCDEVVDTWLSDDERQDLFDTQLPTMVDYALQLKSLKPLRGLHFSLQQQSKILLFVFFCESFLTHHVGWYSLAAKVLNRLQTIGLDDFVPPHLGVSA